MAKEFRTYGRTVEVELEVYGECKYTASEETFENAKRIRYTIESWEIITGGEEAEEIEALTDASGVDDHHEYLVLNLTSGDTATFRNSYVDMWRVRG